ncbi:uncharacterized protein TNCV_1192031 [Trichonephila clavipes]|nr:uncharacterized protein TNCV_1192031 [Trichonephila clavipes]
MFHRRQGSVENDKRSGRLLTSRTAENIEKVSAEVQSRKLLKRAPPRKDASLTPPAEGLLNISKYPGHLPVIACYDGNPRNQGLVGIDGACVNKTLHIAPEDEI